MALVFRSLVEERVAKDNTRTEGRMSPPNGLTVSCGAVPSPPADVGAFKHQMGAFVDPVPRPPGTEVISQLIETYSRRIRCGKSGGGADVTSRSFAVGVAPASSTTGANAADASANAAATRLEGVKLSVHGTGLSLTRDSFQVMKANETSVSLSRQSPLWSILRG
jgi:hypothetical protein